MMTRIAAGTLSSRSPAVAASENNLFEIDEEPYRGRVWIKSLKNTCFLSF
jgi:hypothetical protein